MRLEDNLKAINAVWRDPVGRTLGFFGHAPFHNIKPRSIDPYQLGVYLLMWGELYGNRPDARQIGATGRGTGKTSVFQELCAADMACFMPYLLQLYYGEKKPIDVTIIFAANVKKGSRQRLENVKNLIRSHPYLERHLIDYKQWTKGEVILRNGTMICAEAASDRVRGYHSKHPKGKVIYLCDEFAFWGGSQCMDGQTFVEEIAEQSFGASIGCFTTPYGKRGGAWWAWNNPGWHKFNFPTWVNPRADKRKLAAKVERLNAQGRQIVVDQEIRGLFVDDAGLFFTMEIWMKSINSGLEWIFSDQDNFKTVLREVTTMAERGEKRHGTFLMGLDPNSGSKRAGADPFGIALVEKKGNKYFSRFNSAFNGRSHTEIMQIIKPLCAIYQPKKINFDGGGGYHSGPMVMMKGSPGVQNMHDIPESNSSIVGYMSMLRSLMAMGKFEQPPSEALKDSQMCMRAIGDSDETDEGSEGKIRFQTLKKGHGIPCDLAALGLAVARENVSISDIVSSVQSQTSPIEIQKSVETRRVFQEFDRLTGGLGLTGIAGRLTGVGH